MDIAQQVVRTEAKKVSEYTALLQKLHKAHTKYGHIERLEFASLLGKLQHVAPVVPNGQQLLREAYLSRDNVCSDGDAARPWCVGTKVEVSPEAWADLERLGELLPVSFPIILSLTHVPVILARHILLHSNQSLSISSRKKTPP
jgi:hypothetical protein